jgi:minor extracellular serine protease Vpr
MFRNCFCKSLMLGMISFHSVNAQLDKVNPYGKLLLNQLPNMEQSLMMESDHPYLINVQSGEFTLSRAALLGIKVQSRCGDVWSCRSSLSQMALLAQEQGIRYIEVHPLNAVRAYDDSARKASKIRQAWNSGNTSPIKGKGVVLGIVDVGFQTDHPGFWDSTGNVYRVKRFWNQSSSAGPAPQGFTYGRECKTEQEILVERNDDGTHGTHVAGIAGGSGLGAPGLKYAGVAPETDLVFVNIMYSSPSIPGSAWGDYVIANPAIIDAYDYVLRYAKSKGQRAVTNLSWGMHTGPHDGTSLFDRAVDQLSEQGLVVVGAAGNDGSSRMHLFAPLRGDTLYSFAYDNGRKNRTAESIYTDIWGTKGKTFFVNAALFDTLGRKILETPFFPADGSSKSTWFSAGSDTLLLKISSQKEYPFNGKTNMLLIASHKNPAKNHIRLGFYADSSDLHAWNSGEAYLWSSGGFSNEVKGNDYKSTYLNGNDEHTIGENGGSGNNTISVGAYVTRNTWTDDRNNPRDNKGQTLYTNATFTSRGPRVDGFIKPNVAAPGSEICAPLHNRQLPGWLFDRVLCRDSIKGAWNYYGVLQGTSMASPHVAGIAALMLEADPSLTPATLRTLLQESAKQDAFTGKVPNGIFGYGKVDALAALMAVRTLSDGNTPEHPIQWQLWPNPAQGGTVSIRVPALWKGNIRLQLFDLNGRLLEQSTFTGSDILSLRTGHLPAGTYTLMLQHHHYSTARLLLVP